MTGPLDGCSILLETRFVRTRQCVDTTQVLSVGGFLPSMGAAEKRPEFGNKSTFRGSTPDFSLLFSLKSFHKGILFQDSGGLESDFYLSLVSCQRQWSLTCPFASYIAGTPSHHVIFAYDQIIRTHRSYCPSGGLLMEKP